MCGDNEDAACSCDGRVWIGAVHRLDNNKNITTFDELRKWKTASVYGADTDHIHCTPSEFGFDPLPGVEKQCFCERKPKYVPRICANEGDECTCAGHVIYGRRYSANDSTKNATFEEVQASPFTITEGNSTSYSWSSHSSGKVLCEAFKFEEVDPLPGIDKSCYCDI